MDMGGMRTDLVEKEHEFVVDIEVAGIPKESISIQHHNDQLTITAERTYQHNQKNDRVHVQERGYGKTQRVVCLPSNADGEQISAELRDGILTIHMPKKAEEEGDAANGRHIEIA